MKKNFLIALAVCLASAAGIAAQPFRTLKANIPYPVVIGNVTLPAGDFTITDDTTTGSSSLMIVRSDSGRAATMLMERTRDLKNPDSSTSKLELKPAANGYQIKSIEIEGQAYTAPLH
jgi:hypothetical protein